MLTKFRKNVEGHFHLLDASSDQFCPSASVINICLNYQECASLVHKTIALDMNEVFFVLTIIRLKMHSVKLCLCAKQKPSRLSHLFNHYSAKARMISLNS